MSRYAVTELEGLLSVSVGPGTPGLSCHVIDTHWNHRLVATYRTENEPKTRGRARAKAAVREKAREHAERLNAS